MGMYMSNYKIVGFSLACLAMSFSALAGASHEASEALAQGLSIQSDTKSPSWGPTSEGFALSARTSKSVFIANERVEVNVILTNVTDHALRFGVSKPEFDSIISVKDNQQKDVPATQYRRSFQPTGVFESELAAGKDMKYTIDLRQMFVLERGNSYSVVVSRRIPKQDRSGYSEVASSPFIFICE
jgi:hypothetical protein